MTFTTYVVSSLDMRGGTLAVILDFSRDFDTVWHDGILFKLRSFGFVPHACRPVVPMLYNLYVCDVPGPPPHGLFCYMPMMS